MQRKLHALANPKVGPYRIGSWDVAREEIEENAAKLALKGKQGKNCNRTACQKPFAFFRNSGTNAYYCLECAVDIGVFALCTKNSAMELYPEFDDNLEDYRKSEEGQIDLGQRQADWAKRKYAHARQIFEQNQAKLARGISLW